MTIHGYELIGDWKNSTCGKIAQATKGGKKYFLKKYQTPVAPIDNGALDAKTIAHNQKKFDRFVALRRDVNNRIRPLAGPGGNIIIPAEDFIDGNQYCEASEFVENTIDRGEIVTLMETLDMETKLLLMKTAAGALSSVHGKHVIHSDLKLENMLLARNSSGKYVAKLLDFDSSFTTDCFPEEIIGTINYYSPELGNYGDAEEEEEKEELKKFVTEKTDIFSLGLIFHIYLSGEFPEAVNLNEKLQKRKAKGKLYCWVALNGGGELQISPKITSPKYISLLSDMLNKDPADRPTASQVLKRLQEPDGKAAELVVESPFPEHKITMDQEKIKSAGIIRLSVNVSGSSKQYRALYKDGSKKIFTKEELLAKGYAKNTAPEGYCEPWPEHNVVFDPAVMTAKGYVSCERITASDGTKAYTLYSADGSSRVINVNMLIMLKCAKRKGGAGSSSGGSGSSSGGSGSSSGGSGSSSGGAPKASAGDFAAPWPEHKIAFDRDALKAKGYVSSVRKTQDGINGYEFTQSDGIKRFIRAEMCVMLKIAKKV